MTTTPPEPDQPFGAGQPSYPGAYPTDPSGGSRQAPPAPPQPSSIAMAVKLMWAGAAVSLVSLVVGVAGLGSLKDEIANQLREDDPSVSQSTIDAAYAFGIFFAVVVGGIGVLLWLWMAWKNGQGRGWARVVATILGVLNVLFTLVGLAAQSSGAATTLLSLVNLAIAVVILVLLWRKESTAFYQGTAASRQLY